MKPVAQEDAFGCGVACVAFLLNQTYQVTLHCFDCPEHAKQRGFFCRDIVNALARKGFKYIHRYYRPHLSSVLEKNGTVVFIARNAHYPAGHYLVKTENGWMNPWANFPELNQVATFQSELPGQVQYVMFPAEFREATLRWQKTAFA